MKVVLSAVFLAALAAVASTSSAQEIQGPGKACKADREKFCPDLKPGDGKFHDCMKEHEAELSPECKAAHQAARDAWKTVQTSCKADAGKFCADAEKGRGAVAKCLESHASELEQACADALKSRPGAKKA